MRLKLQDFGLLFLRGVGNAVLKCCSAVLLLVFMSSLLPVAAGFAQNAKSQQQPADAAGAADTGWVVNCQPGGAGAALVCQMSETITDAKTSRLVLGVVIRPGAAAADGKEGLGMLFALPHGLYFPAGISYGIDGGEVHRVAVQTSDPRGAYAAIPIDAAGLEALKRGTTLTVSMVDVQRKSISVPVSLSGFTAAVDKLDGSK